jgi:hypothetical protein
VPDDGIKDYAHWNVGDEVVAHGMSVKIDAKEMENLQVCTCQYGGSFVTNESLCATCGRRRFVYCQCDPERIGGVCMICRKPRRPIVQD